MIYVYTDGACEPKNPGGHGVGGWVIKTRHDFLISKGAIDLGCGPEMTNNISEYGAVYGALQALLDEGAGGQSVTIMTDSKLVVEQLNDNWKCNHDHLRAWRDKIWNLVEHFGEVSFQWIPREENEEADEMSRSLYQRD